MRAALPYILLLLCSCATTYRDFDRALADARSARCATAFCLGEDAAIAIEPLVEVPVGKTFAISGPGPISNYVNNNGLTAEFNLGVRVWLFHDLVSVGTYLSEPLMPEGPGIRFQGSRVVHTSLDRPYPGVALGLLGDMLWLGLDYNQLHNGGRSNADPNFQPDQPLGKVWTFSVAIAPVSSFRFGLGSATARNERERTQAANRKAQEREASLQVRRARLSELETQHLDLLVAAADAAQEYAELVARHAATGADYEGAKSAEDRAMTREHISKLRLEVTGLESELLRAEVRALSLGGLNVQAEGVLSTEARDAESAAADARAAFALKKAEFMRAERAAAASVGG